MNNLLTTGTILALLSFHSFVFAASYQKAEMLNKHGLTKAAKTVLIDILFTKGRDSEKAQAYYLLGVIAFNENRTNVALDSWRDLVKKFPKSAQAALVKDRIQVLSEVVSKSAKETLQNVVARAYLRRANFWSKGKDKIYTIDSSWIPNVESAIKWYDKVIKEFPNTPASRQAYKGKMRTLLGWKTRGRHVQKYGIKSDFSLYMNLLIQTFSEFKNDYPNNSMLQPFRYQIAQAYWHHRDWAKTREWLQMIITTAGNKDSFYKDLAERRLEKVEY